MIHAYSELYLEKACTSLGCMIDTGVNHLGYSLTDFWNSFLSSPISSLFESGDSSTIAGRSGIELAFMVSNKYVNNVELDIYNRSEEYWLGSYLAYYQWKSGQSFKKINEAISITDLLKMYYPYHEMDVRQFCDRVQKILDEHFKDTNLKRIRTSCGLTQSELSKETNIPLRTIQQYEQRQKNINHAKAEYIILLSKALYCSPQDLLENNTEEI